MTNSELANLLSWHPPKSLDTTTKRSLIREYTTLLATKYNDLLPESREKSLAITNLQNATMWANAAIAIHQPVPEQEISEQKEKG